MNKTTAVAKAAIEQAGQNIGGAERLTEWIKEDPQNESDFWKSIYPKLLPLQVNGSGDNGEIVHKVITEYVKPRNQN